jgi:hypothetical protein
MKMMINFSSYCRWSLTFATGKDGFALMTLYRKCAILESPVLLVIQDTSEVNREIKHTAGDVRIPVAY